MEKTIKTLQTRIERVIVYQNGAQVIQLGKIKLTKGEQILSITNLPNIIDKESVRIKGIGEGKIININIEPQFEKKYKKEAFQELKELQEKLQKQLQLQQKQLEYINEQIEKFKITENNFYADFAKAYAFGETPLSKFEDFDSKINEYLTINMKASATFVDKIKELKIELQVVDNKISHLGPLEEVSTFYNISINLNVIQDGEFSIELRYNINQVWWIPFYDIILSENEAKLIMMANVYNRTGQDWKDIQIEISTAAIKPIELKKPSPLLLEEIILYENEKYVKKKGRTTGFRGLAKPDSLELRDEESYDTLATGAEEEALLSEETQPEIETSYAEVSENIGIQSFKIPNLLNIPSDKNPHPVNLIIRELDTKKKYYWSSAAPENIIIRDEIINSDIVLLAGNVKIYFLEEFLGETNIPIIAPKEKFKLGTRISYDLRVEKKLIDRSKDKKVLKGRLKNNYEYNIMIKNLKNITDPLTIFDRIPHSSSENIKVEIESIQPDTYKKELGILKWKINLKDITEKVIHYKYCIEYKEGIQITPPIP